MDTFGRIKIKIIENLTEAYIAKDKKKITSIIKLIKENKNFVELYEFYEDVEQKYIEDIDVAKLYVESVKELLQNKSKDIEPICEKLEAILTKDVISENKVYDALDQLLSKDSMKNIDKKILAKKNLIDYLTTKKEEKAVEEIKSFTVNENLLATVLVNNFNSKFTEMLDESEREKFKEIVSLTNEELTIKINETKETINTKISNILTENNDIDLKNRLEEVKERINSMDYSRLSYYKMNELEKDL